MLLMVVKPKDQSETKKGPNELGRHGLCESVVNEGKEDKMHIFVHLSTLPYSSSSIVSCLLCAIH